MKFTISGLALSGTARIATPNPNANAARRELTQNVKRASPQLLARLPMRVQSAGAVGLACRVCLSLVRHLSSRSQAFFNELGVLGQVAGGQELLHHPYSSSATELLGKHFIVE